MSEIRVDTISEKTSANGVAVDGVTLKDGGFTATLGSTITTADNTTQLTLKSTDADASVGPDFVLQRDSGSPADDDSLGRIRFVADNDAGEALDHISINATIRDASDGTEDAQLTFNMLTAGAVVDAFHISPTETVFNDASADRNFRIESNDNATMLVVDGENNRVGFGTNPGRDFQFLTTDQTDVSIIAANNQYAQLLFGDPDDDNIGSIGYNNSTNIMEFTTNAAHQWSIDASGNWLPAATDHGIYLGVSSATAANLLNDFEIGHYTAALTTGSGSVTVHSSFNQLRYTKIGKLVHVQGYIETNAESSASGTLRVNLPFAIQSSDNSQRSGRSASALLFTIGSNNANTEKGNWVLTIEGAGTSASIVRNNGTNFADDVGSDVDSSCVFIFNIHYMTD